jgi:hypothetical protein
LHPWPFLFDTNEAIDNPQARCQSSTAIFFSINQLDYQTCFSAWAFHLPLFQQPTLNRRFVNTASIRNPQNAMDIQLLQLRDGNQIPLVSLHKPRLG